MRRLLHTMLRVTDLQRSIAFYTDIVGMKLLRTLDQPDEKYTLAFLGFDEGECSCELELTYNYDVKEYQMGNAYGHIAISVENCEDTLNQMRVLGAKVLMHAKKLNGSNEIIAFISDPDGYAVELIQFSN